MRKKMLYLKMGTHNLNMSISLNTIFEVYEIDWLSYPNNWVKLNWEIRHFFDMHKPEIVFMHLQCGDVVNLDLLHYMSQSSITISWTGDVRHPIPEHYIATGKHINITLFTNYNDVVDAKNQGIEADFLQVGYDDNSFIPSNHNAYDRDIVFLGSNYNNIFPLSNQRFKMVEYLRNLYGKRFEVFGSGWHGYESGSIKCYEKECYTYQRSKIAINLSHFNYSRYSSDRMFRLMGSGAFCLSHSYPDIEQDFKIGKDLDVWHNLDDLTKKIDYYLHNDHQRIEIAKTGCEHVRNNFTWLNFAKNLLHLTNNL